MNKKLIKKIIKDKRFIFVCILFIILIICFIFLKNLLYPNGTISAYGNRLTGIEDIKFEKKDKNTVIDKIKENENVTDAKMNVHGKIINIIYNVKKEMSFDDSKKIAEESLGLFSEDVKKFYDIQFIITKNDEEGKEVEDNGEKKIIKEFPKMGYKNAKSEGIVW